jgi:hypothetical protein
MSNLKSISTSDLLNELSRRGYDQNFFNLMISFNSRMTKAYDAVNWSNWENEDKTHMKLGEVYWSKLDWIKDTLDEDDEAYDTITDLQETICPILNLLDNE